MGCTPDPRGARSPGGRSAGEQIRTGQTEAHAQFYLHRMQVEGQIVEFAVSLQATNECAPGVILRLPKRSHVLDPTCQHGRRLYVLVHRSEPLLTRQ